MHKTRVGLTDQIVFQALSVPVVVSDPEGKILQANQAACTLLNADELTLTGLALSDLLAGAQPGPRENIYLPLAHVIGTPRQDDLAPSRFLINSRPGLTVEMATTPLLLDGKLCAHAHVLRDITQQIQAVREREEFLINVVHELRSPLAALRASIELLLEDYRSMKPREMGVMLKSLHKSSIKFQTLIESLTQAESIRAGKFVINLKPTPLDEILHDALTQTNPLIRSRAQTVELKQTGSTGLVVMADRSRVLQIIINLITNASKYGPEEQPIVLSTCQSEGFAFVGVTDFGEGIPQEEQKHIFQRFYRAKNHEHSGSGIGLGMGIVREIVEAHGGAIHLTSEPGSGTTFWFSLKKGEAERKDTSPEASGANS